MENAKSNLVVKWDMLIELSNELIFAYFRNCETKPNDSRLENLHDSAIATLIKPSASPTKHHLPQN